MDIILDSNIIRSDFYLKSPDFDVVQDYLQKTNGSIIMPQIIWDEILGLYRRMLTEKLSKFKSAQDNVNGLIRDQERHIKTELPDIKKETDIYETFLRDKLSLQVRAFLPYNDTYLQRIVKKAINREKPCGEDGQGFRDALIWLTMLDYICTSFDKQIILISQNTSDFGKNGELYGALKKECQERNITVHYFDNIQRFIEIHSTKVEFVTEKWIRNSISDQEIFELVVSKISSDDPFKLFSYIEHQTKNELVGIKDIKRVQPYSFNNISVYEMAGKALIVNCNVYCTLTVEALEFADKMMIIETFRNTDSTIQIVASLSLTVEDAKIARKNINSVNYYTNI